MTPKISTTDTHFEMPGMATAHSHAFQRLLRGRTQRRITTARSFWSWRSLMYRLVQVLSPDDMFDIARLAYAELAMGGVTMIGEFHYLHHDQDGRPFAKRTEMSDAMIRAAADVGVRISLLRTGYMRGGYKKSLEPAQQRFCDPNVETIVQDIDTLRSAYADQPFVRIGVAAHSIRAVPIEAVVALDRYAAEHHMPFHMHVSEQRRELEESLAEYHLTPVDLLNFHGVLSDRFVAVHATHLSRSEIGVLGQHKVNVCLCRTTERDLGDGLPQTADLIGAGATLSVGVDSHCGENPFEEIRAIELDERSRLEGRHAAVEAPKLLEAATVQGYLACGFDPETILPEDRVTLLREDPSLLGIDPALAADGILFAATPRAIDEVWVGGERIVENGQHRDYHNIAARYTTCMQRVLDRL